MNGHQIIEHDAGPVACLPESPAMLAVSDVVEACRRIYENRVAIIEGANVDTAREGLRRAQAIERYVSAKEAKDDARRASRVLEAAVGRALGAKQQGQRTDLQLLPREVEVKIPHQDAHRFRRMNEYRDVWMPVLDEKALSRKQVLTMIDEALRPEPKGPGSATIYEAEAINWLADAPMADLLLTDPPYSTDVDDIEVFVSEWLPAALGRIKQSGRAFVFIGAYAPELGAYFSQPLPDGWEWGVPHAWCYRNTIGPTPGFDFIRNWQCMLTARGPDAPPMNSDRITDLLAGFVENAPDGRRETKLHRWQKPLAILDRLTRLATDPEGVVIDPFSGSGTTLVAARDAGRHGFGCDTDPEAVRTCIERGCNAG